MSKSAVLKYMRDFPTKARRGFTIYEVARYTNSSTISVYITLRRLRMSGFISVVKSRGRGRGRGKTRALYYFTQNGLNWLKRYNIAV